MNSEQINEQKKEIKLTEKSVLRNKSLTSYNSYYIIDAHPEKKTENINSDESDDSNEIEQKFAFSEHPLQTKNSNNH